MMLIFFDALDVEYQKLNFSEILQTPTLVRLTLL